MSYFVIILSGVENIFLLGCPQVFSLLNIRFRGISKPQKVLFKEEDPLIDSIDKIINGVYIH